MIENFEELLLRDKPEIVEAISRHEYWCISHAVYNSGIDELFVNIQLNDKYVEFYAIPADELCGRNDILFDGKKMRSCCLPLKNEKNWQDFLKLLSDI